jgi:hypothetical protein
MPRIPRLKSLAVVKLIMAYEQTKFENEILFEEMLYLIKGVSQKYIRWQEVSPADKFYRRLPPKLEKLTEKGFFQRAGKKSSAMVYITDAGRDRLSEIFGELEEVGKAIKLQKRYPHGTRDKIVIERRGLGWQFKSSEIYNSKRREAKKQ